MGGKGNSSNRSNSNSASNTTYNVDNSVRTSDFGAIAGAVEISKEALSLGGDALATGEASWRIAADLARDVTYDSMDFANRGLGFAHSTLEYLADSAESTQRNVLEGARDMFDQSVSSISALATQTSATGDDRVAKVATYAVMAVAAAMVLPALFRKAS